MRDCGSVFIDQIIVHILDTRDDGIGFVASQRELPLAGNDELRAYFTNHIEASIGHSAATAARFRTMIADETAGLCAALHKGTGSFVDGSQRIAERLYKIMAKDRRTKEADLAVCFYRTENYGDRRYLGLLKVDPSQVFQHDVQTDEEGRRFVTYVLEPSAFTNEKLQKCAFIRPLKPRHEKYDMILLDRQVSDKRRRDVAQYFARDFLDAVNAYDAYDRTDQLYGTLLGVRRLLETPQEQATLDVHIESILRSRQFNADEWLARLPFAEETTERITQAVREKLPDRAFEIDQAWVAELRKKRVFRGAYNLKVQVDADRYDDVIRDVELVADDPDRTEPYYRITIETEKWSEVRR